MDAPRPNSVLATAVRPLDAGWTAGCSPDSRRRGHAPSDQQLAAAYDGYPDYTDTPPTSSTNADGATDRGIDEQCRAAHHPCRDCLRRQQPADWCDRDRAALHANRADR